MTDLQAFATRYQQHLLKGDVCTGQFSTNDILCIHGAGKADRSRYSALRSSLHQKGFGSVAFDCIGHGETGGLPEQSSLISRTYQAEAVLQARDMNKPLTLIGASMGGYCAIDLTQTHRVNSLTEDVKQRAIAVVEGGANLPRWSGKQLDKRRAVLAELKDKLLSAQPKPRRPRKLKLIETPPRHEVKAPDGLGKAVAFSMPGAIFMQIYIEREVGGSRGGGGVFLASCAFDDVDLEWLPGPVLLVTYPRGITVQMQCSQNFYFGEVIPIVYQVKG